MGSGAGSATVGTVGAADITVTGSTSGALFPLTAAPAANTSITVTNSGSGHEFVKTVSVDPSFGGGTGITTNKPATGLPGTYCDPSWFEFDHSPVTIGQDLAGGGGTYTATNAATLWLVNNTSVDQSGCEGAVVTVHYLSN